MRKWLIGVLVVVAAVAAAFAFSPWPSILLVRAVFDRGAAEASQKLQRHVPASVTTSTVQYALCPRFPQVDIPPIQSGDTLVVP